MSKVVLIGATGAVGGEILGILAQRAFPLSSLEDLCWGAFSWKVDPLWGGCDHD